MKINGYWLLSCMVCWSIYLFSTPIQWQNGIVALSLISFGWAIAFTDDDPWHEVKLYWGGLFTHKPKKQEKEKKCQLNI